MRFIVGSPGFTPQSSTGYLEPDGWDDWFKYSTLYKLVVCDATGKVTTVGPVKIGQFNQTERRPSIPQEFEKLGEEFFSLGQDENYYETLFGLEQALRLTILAALRDCAHDTALFDRAQREPVMYDSLLRFVDKTRVKARFRAILEGNAVLTSFDFAYQLPPVANSDVVELSFSVQPQSTPPTNLHAIIGRNGVGKTRCLRSMVKALGGEDHSTAGKFAFNDTSGGARIVNVVSIAFSAFDPFEPLPEGDMGQGHIRFTYVGLRRSPQKGAAAQPASEVPPKTLAILTQEFVSSLLQCTENPRLERWRAAVAILSTDPLFEEGQIAELLNASDDSIGAKASEVFGRLSSGHKIVLLTVTRLVELVDEQTLVLIDEPEAHLHPPLLSAFMRALSYLLIRRNGVSIIATHSPVVLQETPQGCVWLMDRVGSAVVVRRPDMETFAENVGSLTREVFGLEVTHSGFNKLIRDVCENTGSYEEVLARFGNQLGSEGRALARAYFNAKQAEGATEQ